MASSPLYGWEMTFKSAEKTIKRTSDIILVFVHWNLTKRGFRVVGIGDEGPTTSGSEVLPTGWNDKETYALRYVMDNKLYFLHGMTSASNLIINLIRSDDLVSSNIALNVNDTVQDEGGDIEKMMPNYKELMFNLKRDLIDAVTERPTTTAETQTSTNSINQSNPLRVTSRPVPRGENPSLPNLWNPPDVTPFNIGHSDLNPFGSGMGGGGMLFQPFGPRRDLENPGLGIPGGLPRGAVPPGARFDPFAPPGAGPVPGPMPGVRPPPDADHLPPPGFDDMFS